MIVCEACEKRREWINRWANIALERAKHLWSNDDEPNTGTTTARPNKRPKRTNASDKPVSTSDRATDNGTNGNRARAAADV